MNDKGLQIFSCLTELRDELVLESDIHVSATVLTPRRERFGSFLTSGWGVAILCAVVSLGLMVGLLMQGGGGDQTPIPPAMDTGTEETSAIEENTPDGTVTDETVGTDAPSVTTDASDETEQPDGGESVPRLTDYDTVLDTFREMVRICMDHPDGEARRTAYETAFKTRDESEKSLCDKLFLAISDHGSAGGEASFGYAVVNVNAASGRELVLLGSDLSLLAIFTESDNGVFLLDAFHASYAGYIDKNGLLVAGGVGDAGKPTTWRYRIAPDDASLLLTSTREGAGLSSVKEVASAYNGRFLGAYYTPLFGEPADRTAEIADAKRLYRERVMEYFYLWGSTPIVPVHIILIDLNEDGMPEAIVEHGCSVYILHYDGGKVYETFLANTDNSGIYALKTDGTACYSSTTGGSYGARRLRVNGGSAEWIDLWRVEDGGKRFYVQGVEVTKEEFVAYDNGMCKEHATWYGWSQEQIEECFAISAVG